jgi:hypothetical protein
MATAAEIRERAATMLGILGEGETLPSYEAADLDQSYTEVYDALEIKGHITWDFDDDIPDAYAPHIAALVAWGRVDDYSVPNDRYTRIRNAAKEAPYEIKELNTSDALETAAPDYY